jgi:hypothetical protein
MYGGMCHGHFTVGMINMVGIFTQAKVPFQFAYMMNESLITRARDSLTHDFLNTECTHLMFIDSDIGFNPQDILPMIGANKDIICGLYPRKEIDWFQVEQAVKNGVPATQLHDHTGVFVMNTVDGSANVEASLSQPLEISNGGTGFMLINRRVFEGLADKVPEYNGDMFLAVDTERKPRVIKQFFDTSIDTESDNRLLSEDYHFCKIARQAGFKVWAAPWAQLSHTGSYTFSGHLRRV